MKEDLNKSMFKTKYVSRHSLSAKTYKQACQDKDDWGRAPAKHPKNLSS
jgi:hypothetical protein